jgi:hypothetical protein
VRDVWLTYQVAMILRDHEVGSTASELGKVSRRGGVDENDVRARLHALVVLATDSIAKVQGCSGCEGIEFLSFLHMVLSRLRSGFR